MKVHYEIILQQPLAGLSATEANEFGCFGAERILRFGGTDNA